MRHLFFSLLKTCAAVLLWAVLLIPCHRLFLHLATEHYPAQGAVHPWFTVVIEEKGQRGIVHPERLSASMQVLRAPFDTRMGFYLQHEADGLYEAGNELGLGMTRSRYRITSGGTVEPVSFVYEAIHNVILPSALSAAVLVSLLFKLIRRYLRKRKHIQAA